MNEPPYRLEVDDLGPEASAAERAAQLHRRPWVGIRFDCCGVYTRVYRNRAGTAYQGACPRCGRPVTLRIGPEGTDARFFVAE